MSMFLKFVMLKLPDSQVKINVSKAKTHLYVSRLPDFQISRFPDFQVNINVGKAKTHLHISGFPHLHISTPPEYQVYVHVSKFTKTLHIFTFQGYSRVVNFMYTTFLCDDVSVLFYLK